MGIRDNGVPGAKYNLPEDTGTDPCGAVFGKMTADRFPVSDNGVPGPKYDLPEEHDACNAVFGKMTGDRFVDLDNMVPGPGAYEAPKRFFDPKLAEPCFAVFGKDNAERMHVVEDVTKDTFAKYDVEKAHNVQSTALKVPTSSSEKKPLVGSLSRRKNWDQSTTLRHRNGVQARVPPVISEQRPPHASELEEILSVDPVVTTLVAHSALSRLSLPDN